MPDTSSKNSSLGVFASLLGNISVATCGVAGKRTVAIQCRGGRSSGAFLVFDGPVEPSDRYDGMKLAFGSDVEIFKPNRQGELGHEMLDAAAYNKLLVSVEKRYQARNNNLTVHRQVSNDALRYHRERPVWNWGLEQKYGRALSLLYAVFALAPLLCLTVAKIVNKENLIPEFLYGFVFLGLKSYCRKLLDIHRDICYIKVAMNELEASHQPRWRSLRERARPGAPEDGKAAVEDIKFGHTRVLEESNTEHLLVPVMKLTPTLSFDKAQWWFIARRFRGPLLTCSYLSAGDMDHRWCVAFGICAFVQACLQDDIARVFLANTQTYEVTWFRHMEDQEYPEEHRQYRRALK